MAGNLPRNFKKDDSIHSSLFYVAPMHGESTIQQNGTFKTNCQIEKTIKEVAYN